MKLAISDITETMGLLKLEDIIRATGGEVIYLNEDSFTG
jgi:hypothetical protein